MASVPFFEDQSATDILRRSGSAGGQIIQAGPRPPECGPNWRTYAVTSHKGNMGTYGCNHREHGTEPPADQD